MIIDIAVIQYTTNVLYRYFMVIAIWDTDAISQNILFSIPPCETTQTIEISMDKVQYTPQTIGSNPPSTAKDNFCLCRCNLVFFKPRLYAFFSYLTSLWLGIWFTFWLAVYFFIWIIVSIFLYSSLELELWFEL